MEVLCFTSAPSPLLRTKFTGKETVKSSNSFTAVRRSSRRMEPLIYSKVLKPLNSCCPSVAECEPVPTCTYDQLKAEVGQFIENPDKGNDDKVDVQCYLREIRLSKVYDVAKVSPFLEAALLYDEEDLKLKYMLKRDDVQSVFSFKLRGAYNMMSKLAKEQLEKGVITASAGNHAQGVALAARQLSSKALIVMPVHTPDIKIQAVKRLGGEVDLQGESFDEAQAYALEKANDLGLVYVPPFDNQDIVVGQGTVGKEILEQMQEEPYAIFVPIGGGGLISGIAACAVATFPNVKIIGVEPTQACGMALSFQLGKRVGLKDTGTTLAEGTAVAVVGDETYNICKRLVDGIVVVEDKHMAAAIKDVYNESRTILEFSGALALAGAKAYARYNDSQRESVRNKSIVAVCSGANLDFEKLDDVVYMAGAGGDEEAILATKLPEQPGSLKRFCELVLPSNIIGFKYRYDSSKEKALVQYSVAYGARAELDAMVEGMKAAQLETCIVSDHELVLKHLQHLVGGQSKVENEILCEVKLPDKPGAFLKFLNTLNPLWNISLVQYRTQGSLDANVLVGIQVVQSEMEDFHNRAKSLGYTYKVHPKHESLQFLIG